VTGAIGARRGSHRGTVVCDDGWKYRSSEIYTRPFEEIESLESTLWW
jgi:hypothetical protein